MDARQAAAVRQALFTDTKVYTYDPKSVPERVVDIRNVIVDIDEQLEKEEVVRIQNVLLAQLRDLSKLR